MDYPERQVVWGEVGVGWSEPQEPAFFHAPSSPFDSNGDGFAEFLSYAEVWYGFGPFQVILGASSRELAVVDGPGKADEDVSHNNLSIVRAGDRFFVLALRPKGDAALTDHAGHFAFAITSVDALPDIPPWRARTLLGVSVSTRVVVDVNGDGRDEVVANYTGVSNDNEQVCLFEVVESP